MTLDEPALVHKAALAGLGLAYLNLWRVHSDIEAKRLIRVLDEWTPAFDGLRLYYPGRRHVPAPLRALVDLVKEIRSGKLLVGSSRNHALMTSGDMSLSEGNSY